MQKFSFLGAAALGLLVVACGGGGEGGPAPGGSGKPAAGSSAGGAQAGGSPAAAAAGDIDLSAAGASFAGMSVKGPAGAKVASDGAGGAQIAFREYQLTVNAGKPMISDMKAGAKAGAEAVSGKVNFTTDKPDELEYVSELKDVTGKDVKHYGFALTLTVGGKPFGCSGVGIPSDAELAAAKGICKSLAKK